MIPQLGWLKAKKNFIFLLLIFGSGAFLRIYDLGSESIWFDEAYSVYFANKDVKFLLTNVQDPHPPLYYVSLHFWINFFGKGEVILRSFSAIFGILSVLAIYVTGKTLFGVENGLYSALILAFSLYHISLSQEVRMYSLLTFLTLMSIFFFIKALKTGHFKFFIGYTVSTALLIYTHLYGVFILLFQNLFFFFFWTEHKKAIKRHMIVQFAIFLLLLPWLLRFFEISLNVLQGAWVGWIPKSNIISLIETLYNFSNTSVVCIILFVGLSLWAFMRIDENKKTGDRKVHRSDVIKTVLGSLKRSYETSLCTMWLWVPIIVPFMISLATQPIFFYKYVTLVSPAFYLMVANGITKIKMRRSQILTVILILLASIHVLSTYYGSIDNEQWREAAGYVENNATQDELILFCAPWASIPFNYYFEGTNDMKGVGTIDDLKKVVTQQPKVWLILSHETDTDPYGFVKKEVDDMYSLKFEREYVGIKIYYYINKTHS